MCSGTVTSRMILVAVVQDLRFAMVGGKNRWGDLGCIKDITVPAITVKCLRMGLIASNSLGAISVAVYSWVDFVQHIAVVWASCVLGSS